MSGPSLSSRQLALAAASAGAAARARAVAEDRRGKPPAAGDRFLLRATADLHVEWVLLESHAERAAFLAVPADTQPLAGATDVEVPAGSAAGALCLRCGFPVWLEATVLDLELRAGAIDEIALAKARQRVREGPPPEATESAGSPAYGDWIQGTIIPALAAVGAGASAPAAPHGERAARRRDWPGLARAAVLAALLLAAALSGWVLRQERRLDQLTARIQEAEAAEKAALAREVSAGETARRSMAGALAQRSAAEERFREQLAELERRRAPAGEVMLNAPFALLYPAEILRGAPKTVKIAGESPYIFAVLSVEEPTSYPSYGVVLLRQGRSKPIWQGDGLKLTNGELSLALPRELLPPGAYRFELVGLPGKKAEPLAEYELVISR